MKKGKKISSREPAITFLIRIFIFAIAITFVAFIFSEFARRLSYGIL